MRACVSYLTLALPEVNSSPPHPFWSCRKPCTWSRDRNLHAVCSNFHFSLYWSCVDGTWGLECMTWAGDLRWAQVTKSTSYKYYPSYDEKVACLGPYTWLEMSGIFFTVFWCPTLSMSKFVSGYNSVTVELMKLKLWDIVSMPTKKPRVPNLVQIWEMGGAFSFWSETPLAYQAAQSGCMATQDTIKKCSCLPWNVIISRIGHCDEVIDRAQATKTSSKISWLSSFRMCTQMFTALCS